jgi:hypothetical protein
MSQTLLYSLFVGMIGWHALRAAMIYRAERAQFRAIALRDWSPHQRQAWVRIAQADLPAAASFSSAAEGHHDPVSRNGSNREPARHFTFYQFEDLNDWAARECAAVSSADGE